jgi:hypothetical protein
MRGVARLLALALALALAATACTTSGGHSAGPRDGGSNDGIVEVSLDLPAGCPPEAGNEKGVGLPCTVGGTECRSPLRCSCDRFLGALLVGVPCFCTLAALAQNGSTDPCKDSVSPGYCGSNATCCNYLNGAAYCVPTICLPDSMCLVFPDAGT